MFVGQPPSGNSRNSNTEPLSISDLLAVLMQPIVEAERLLINIAEQVEGLNADVGSMQPALQQAPKVLHRVGVDILPNVFNRMIDNLMLVIVSKSLIRLQRIAIESRSRFHFFFHERLQGLLTAIIDHAGANLATAFKEAATIALPIGPRP